MKNNSNRSLNSVHKESERKLPGYPKYPAGEDIYSQNKNEENLDHENVSDIKESNESDGVEKRNEKDFKEDVSGSDLDVPGSELDDEDEKVGSEDEENNYYSLGGDNHNNLEEDRDK